MVDQLEEMAVSVGHALSEKGWRLVTAESCTGGWISEVVTSVSGSSDWFDRGFVVYSNRAKEEMLGVSDALIADSGAVSEEVVKAMVEGALAKSGAEVALAVTGIAGPTGGSEDKPVGTVWIGLGFADGDLKAALYHFAGDRRAVREQAVITALHGLLDFCAADDL